MCGFIIGCTEDWFGDWDGLHPGHVDQFITEDLKSGRLVDVIDSGEPAIMVCHWPGIYFNGEKVGFNIFKNIVKRLNEKYNHLVWMKLSEISRYWAAKELSTLAIDKNKITIKATFATPGFTLRVNKKISKAGLKNGEEIQPFARISDARNLKANTFYAGKTESLLCFDLGKGVSEVIV
jgi:hypothetical protein